MKNGGGAREGDWECDGCGNRNYAFRCFCNRCKQPRVLVDHKTPADSKWLPRIGDWICTGCTNNNYASREKCKKCGQPKELAAMPAVPPIPGVSMPTYPSYFARAQAGMDQKPNLGLYGNGGLQQLLPHAPSWSSGGNDLFGLQPPPAWPMGGTNAHGAKGWRNGDWICRCGFHNYASRAQCKKCNAPMPAAPHSSLVNSAAAALGTKRLASDELVHELDSKRLNAGQVKIQVPHAVFHSRTLTSLLIISFVSDYPNPQMYGLQQTFSNQDSLVGSGMSLPAMAPNLQHNVQMPPPAPSHLGIGAKHWRDGDWMCSNCNNHNYSSRSECNRCKTQRDALVQPVSTA